MQDFQKVGRAVLCTPNRDTHGSHGSASPALACGRRYSEWRDGVCEIANEFQLNGALSKIAQKPSL
jgi:hypothetical protein